MGSTSKTQQSNQYDPGSMAQYQGLQGGLGKTIGGYMNQPFSNPFFQTQQQLGTRQAQNMGGTQMGNLMQNMTNSGMQGGASSPAGLEMQQNQARANSGMQAGLGFLNPVQNALGMQQNAMGMAEAYRPLQTGQNQTQSTSGLGTWLPQLMSGLMGGATGGLSHLFGGGGGGGMGTLFQAQNPSLFGQMPQTSNSGFAGASSGMGGWSEMPGYQIPGLSGAGGTGMGMPPPPMPGSGMF